MKVKYSFMTKKYNEKDLINNEQHIYDCFSNTTAFLGLDRVEVSIKGEIEFDMNIFELTILLLVC